MFVVDKISFEERKNTKENAPKYLVLRPKKINPENLIRAFRYTAAKVKDQDFEDFILYQIKNSSDQKGLLKYIKFNYLADLKFQIYDYENRESSIKTFWLNAFAIRAKFRIEALESILRNTKFKDEKLTAFQIALVIHYLDASKDYLLKADMSLEDWEKVAKEYGRNADNIRKEYKKLFRLYDYRLKGKKRPEDLESALVYMRNNKPKARKAIELAEAELEKSLLYNK